MNSSITSISSTTYPSSKTNDLTVDENYACYQFSCDEEFDDYLHSISPKRELVCPITQEVLHDPVVAEDGYTYERTALLRWFSMGRTRSPVTNSFMSEQSIFSNLAIQGMAQQHTEKLGLELLKRCFYIYNHEGKCPDNGSRIASLLDAGADTDLRFNESSKEYDGNTCLLFLIQCHNLNLSRMILDHDSHQNPYEDPNINDDNSLSTRKNGLINISNQAGVSCTSAVKNVIKNKRNSSEKEAWEEFLNRIKIRASQEREILEERNRYRLRANAEHRERQRALAADNASHNNATGGQNGPINVVHGLGSMQSYGKCKCNIL